MSEFIEIVSPSALKNLQAVNDELVKTVANVKTVNENMIGSKTPSGSDSAIKKLTADYDTQTKTIQNLQKQLQQLAKTKQAVIVQSNNLANSSKRATTQTREQAVANQILRTETDRNIKANTLLGGAYARASAQLLILKKEAKDAAIAFGEESKQAQRAAKAASDLDQRIKSADKAVGDYQRNVGNYSNGLVNGFQKVFSSVRQIAYILPGIGIAGIFGLALDPLFEYIKGLKVVQDMFGIETEAIKKSKEAIVEKAKAEDEARGKLASYQSDEISRSKILLENAKNLELPYKTRLAAVTELQTRYPDYLGNLSKEQILAGDTALAEEKLNDALIKRGIALSSQQLIQEEINNGLKNEKWIADKLNEIQTKRLELGKQINEIDPFTKNENLKKKYDELSVQLTRLFYLEGTLKEQYTDKNAKIQESIKFYIAQYNANAKYLGVVHEEEKATKKNTKAKKDNLDVATNSKKAFEENIKALETQLSQLDRFSASYDLVNGLLEIQKQLYDQLFGTVKKGQEETIKGLELTEEQVYADYYAWLKLKDATNEYIKTLSSNAFNKAFNDIGLNSAKMFLDFDENGQSTFDKLIEGADKVSERFAITFQAVGDLSQDVFNKMVNLSNERFDIERANLEKSKQIALLFAGDTASAVQNIEEQYQEKQRAIKNREAQAKKKQAVFNILIDTAQGVVSALASTPPNVPLSIAIGVIGALQAGIVNSQEVPQFFKGVENSQYEGWATKDEKGAEIQIDKKGRIKDFGQNKGAKYTYIEKGDTIFTAEKSAMMFNENLNSILTSNGIDMPKIQINNQAITDAQINRIVDTIANKEAANLNIDKSGLNFYVSNGHSTKQRMNNRVTFKRQSV